MCENGMNMISNDNQMTKRKEGNHSRGFEKIWMNISFLDPCVFVFEISRVFMCYKKNNKKKLIVIKWSCIK